MGNTPTNKMRPKVFAALFLLQCQLVKGGKI